MVTLILKKECKGYYSNKVGSVEVTVSECQGWTGQITDWSKSNEDFILYTCYGDTKKSVVEQLVKFLK